MTLINGDKIITAQLYDDEHEEFTVQKMSIIDYVNAYTVEGVTTADVIEQPRWIPVSERLPEEYKRVLVSDSWCGVYVGQYVDAEENWGGEHFINEAGMHSKTVVAWMPLPKPYEPQESEG